MFKTTASIKVLWATEGDLFYLGYLISQFLDPFTIFSNEPTQQEIDEGVNFCKKLILVTSGLITPEFFDSEFSAIPPNLESALGDFIDFFLLIYPHLEPYNSESEHWANLGRRQQQLWGCLT